MQVFRGTIFHFLSNPALVKREEDSYQFINDGLLITEQGKVREVRPFQKEDKNKYKVIQDYSGKLLLPGFVDAHLHYPQTEIIASYGEQLLIWLQKYTYPAELKFSDRAYAVQAAQFFLGELLRNGTTCAAVFPTVHKISAEVLFEQALVNNMSIISGKVLMDRNAPEGLLDSADSGYKDSRELIEKWHHTGRLRYAVTPRFAPTSSPHQLEMALKLKEEYPDIYIQTHLSENEAEVEWVRRLFPDHSSYMGVYHEFGLTGHHSLFAHSIHLNDAEWTIMQETNSAAVFCPSANLFLGSGLFELNKARENGVPVALGSDIGAGTSFSALKNMSDAYKVSRLSGYSFSPLDSFYMATLGGASALDLDSETGNFSAGKYADFVVLDWNASALQARRQQPLQTIKEKLFALMMLGDDRNVVATYIAGQKRYSKV
ncbi:guanine deaminase [Vibrio albus]|uniref:Guanine deaminase n=1 Tax=Vibrio albus TaxID=2200953 RepID=A0A2U3BBU4_9VIBR|nr:guanine deaminase [Vibrio albus]PWI34248.1 guanine deaminase [Vibrio albus]